MKAKLSHFLAAFCLFSLVDASAKHSATTKTLNSADAEQELKAGNRRFQDGKLGSCANPTATRKKLTATQAPDAIVLSCSDSRVPPEQVFDQGLGKLFVVRVAGNILNPEAIASIEYGIATLGTHLIVILGHESCGAVKAAIDTSGGKNAGSPSLNQLLEEIRQNLGSNPGSSEGTLREPVEKNVSAVADSLVAQSKIVRDAVQSGQVRVTRAIYGLDSGRVEFWN